MSPRGATAPVEQQDISALADKLDAVITLLTRIEAYLVTPVPVVFNVRGNEPPGHTCGVCGTWVAPFTLHTCGGSQPTMSGL